jgi:hypothetical protein
VAAQDWPTGAAGPPLQSGLSSALEPKRRFVPSRHEAKRVMKLVRAIRAGHLRPRPPPPDPATADADAEAAAEAAARSRYYDIWAASAADASRRIPEVMRLRAPKLPLPGTSPITLTECVCVRERGRERRTVALLHPHTAT